MTVFVLTSVHRAFFEDVSPSETSGVAALALVSSHGNTRSMMEIKKKKRKKENKMATEKKELYTRCEVGKKGKSTHV